MNLEMKAHIFQRKMLGIMCALLAPACLVFGLPGEDTNLPGWYMSISATYYASSKICMIGLLFTTAVFFFSYQCYDDWRDKVLAKVQAISALGIIIFPCQTPGIPNNVGMFSLPIGISNTIHCAFASILFIAFALNITFLFTLGNSGTPEKLVRNKIYRACGITIFAFCIVQFASSATPLFDWVPAWFPLTWFNEFVMLEAFGIAWLVKSESIKRLNDKEEEEK
ncbi:MAG: hypothetical protein MJZ23_05415 [Paludibacteraceae bacterium]|nr:hypothetical protein [Paludibacteraceae bacterium]